MIKVVTYGADILPSNINLPLQSILDGSNGHSFSDTYLRYAGDRIVSDIKSSLDKLQNNDEQLPQDPCISPPELTLVHKAWGVGFASADFVINNTKKGAVYIANGAYNVGAAIGNFIRNTALAINKTLSGLLATAVESLPDVNSVTTILPNISEAQNTNKETISPQTTNKETTTTESISIPDQTENIINNISQPVVPEIVFHGNGSARRIENTPTPKPEPEPEPAPLPPPPPTPDTTAPIITILGNNPEVIRKNSIYSDVGATVLDNIDGLLTATMTGTVDTTQIGDYIITYTATDLAGNISTATRTVKVVSNKYRHPEPSSRTLFTSF